MQEIVDCFDYFNRVLPRRFDPRQWVHDYQNGTPVPMIVLDDFIPASIYKAAVREVEDLPEYHWTNFTRNHSFMRECNTFDSSPLMQALVNCFNSSSFVTWLESLTKIKHVIPDPHLIGAGLSRCHSGNCLKLHTDFNWNDELQLNRVLSLIWYFHPEWQTDWGGDLEFWDFQKENKVISVSPRPNRLLIWHYDERLIHGYPSPLQCPEDRYRLNLRMFYYTSNSTPMSPPHRSLYWWDDSRKIPMDDRTQV